MPVSIPSSADTNGLTKIVIRRRNRPQRLATQRFVIDERLVIAGHEEAFGFVFEVDGPVVGIGHMTAPCVRVQVVNEVSAADDQHAFRP
jgi:hypothetical protein